MEQLTDTEVVLRKYLFAEVLNNKGFMRKFATVQNGLAGGDQVHVIGAAGYYEGKTAQCKPNWVAGALGSNLTWALGEVGIYKEWCQDAVTDDLMRYKELYNLTEVEAFNKIVQKTMSDSVVNNALALTFLGDTSSSDATLKMFDGFIKRLATIATSSSARKTALDLAEGDTNASLQTKAIEYLRKIEKEATPELRGASDRVWVMTQSVWDGVVDELLLKGINIESQWDGLLNGVQTAKWAGIEAIILPGLDAAIAGNSNCALASTPNFAMLASKSNLLVGTNGTMEDGIANVRVFNTDDMTTRCAAIYKMGTMVVDPKLVQFCY